MDHLRRFFGGLAIGSMHIFLLAVIDVILINFVGIPEELTPTIKGSMISFIGFVLFILLFSGLLGLAFFRYATKKRAFFVGALNGFILHIPISFSIFVLGLLKMDTPELLGLVQFSGPVIIGGILAIFLFPEERIVELT